MNSVPPYSSRSPEQQLLRQPYARILIPEEDGTYSADMLEFPGCHAEGDTPDEAISNLEKAAASWIRAALGQGQTIPPPKVVHGFSGTINLRLPKSIHKQAARFAEMDRVSLNQFFTSAIAARVGAEEFCEQLVQRLESRVPITINIVRVVQTSSDFLFSIKSVERPLQYQRTGAILDKSSPITIESKGVASNG